jgi:hypothetical protein
LEPAEAVHNDVCHLVGVQMGPLIECFTVNQA